MNAAQLPRIILVSLDTATGRPMHAAANHAASNSTVAASPRATTYNDKVIRQFAVMTVIWGIVGMLVGVIIAAQLYWMR